MKKCPYCAEEIQDEAIKCRYCQSDLTVPPPITTASGKAAQPQVASSEPAPTPASSMPMPASERETPPETASGGTVMGGTVLGPSTPTPSPAQSSQQEPPTGGGVRYSHSGYRYVLGYGPDFFGIWDRQNPSVPAERFPRTDDGWRQAWMRFASLEPNSVSVPDTGGQSAGSSGSAWNVSAGGGTSAWGGSGGSGGSPTAGGPGPDTDAVQYTHSGQRYLLGYGRSFFGIWDRTAPSTPVERFSRDDSGWQAAWRRFTQLETHYTEVGLGGS